MQSSLPLPLQPLVARNAVSLQMPPLTELASNFFADPRLASRIDDEPSLLFRYLFRHHRFRGVEELFRTLSAEPAELLVVIQLGR